MRSAAMTAGAAALPAAVFGTLLREFREAAGLSQEDLAERAGLTASAIGALERGERRRPYPHTVQALAEALGLDDTRRTTFIAAIPKRTGSEDVPARGVAPAARRSAERTAPDLAAPGAPADGPHPGGARQLPREPVATRLALPNLGRGAPAFVGRRDELAELRARLADTVAGQGSVVMLVGEAGIGKTRLAHEFADGAAAQGAAVLWGCCFEGDWQPAYGPWVEALGAYARVLPAETLERQLGAGAAPIAQLVPEIRAALPDLPVLSPLSPDDERFRLHDAIIRLLLAASREQPVLLVLDDLHWADPDSLRLLRHVARFLGQARVLVVGAYRDPEFGVADGHPLLDTLSVLRRETEYIRVAIQGFSHDEVAEYLAQAAGEPLPQALVRAIEEETDGNPFYAREVFRYLAEEARVVRRDGRWSTDRSIGELGIPDGVRQVVGRRVARLPAQTSALLRLAAGFTAGFAFDVLQALSELPEQALLDCLDEALQAGLLRVTDQTPPCYTFAHAIVRHTLYDGLNLDRRARLHRRIALALERVRGSAGGEAEDEAELAAQYHASAALPGAERGIPHALRAAQRAHEAYSHGRSAAYLRMARDLASSRPAGERAEILRGLAICEAQAVELDRARRTVEAALEAMQAAAAPLRAQAEFLATVARALKEGGATTAIWGPLAERGLTLVGDTRDLSWARLALLRDHFELIQSGPVVCAHWLGTDPEAIAVARAEGDEEDYARTLEPFDCRTREETEAILALASRWSRPVAVMQALEVTGRDLLYRHGAFQEGERVYEELLAAGGRYASLPAQAEALSHLTSARVALGQLRLARDTLRRAQEAIAHLGSGHRLHFASTNIEIFLDYFLDEDEPGDWARLSAAIAARATGPAAAHSPAGIIAAANTTLSATQAGNAQAARALLPHVTAVAERAPSTAYCHSSWITSAASAVWHLEAEEYAPAYRRVLLNLLRIGAADSINGPLELWVARMAALLGNLEQARDYFERAREKASANGKTHVCGVVDCDEARALIRSGATDRAHIAGLLDAATETFRTHGMLGWASRAAEQAALAHVTAAALGPATSAEMGTVTGPAAAARTSGDGDSLGHSPAGLTVREVEVLRRVAAGMSNKEIAAALVVSVPTVERHVANIYGKIGAGRRYDAIAFARSHGLDAGPP